MHPNDGRVVSNFIIQALQNKDITIYGNGDQTRSFQFVDDLVSGLVALMTNDYTQPVNLGNPEEYTVKVIIPPLPPPLLLLLTPLRTSLI
jgi:UDP-glucuronate decarboxylase